MNPPLIRLGRAGSFALLLFLPLQGVLFFLLLIVSGLRARTSFLTAVSLTTYSEFALIVANVELKNGFVDPQWLVVAALTVALSFVVAAPLNAFAPLATMTKSIFW